MNNVGTSYLLWLLGFLGFAGVHRFYNRKPVTGLLWFFTWGLFGIGQLIDLFLIPSMVEEHNARVMFRRSLLASGRSSQPFPFDPAAVQNSKKEPSEHERKQQLMLNLLQSAEARNGKISVTQGVMDTGRSFSEVEAVLREMAKTGYVVAHNDPTSGVLMFDFIELGQQTNLEKDPVDRAGQVFPG